MALTQRSIGKSRHRMILLVLTAITLLSLDLSSFGPLGTAQRLVRDLLHPITEVAGAIVSPFSDAWNAVFDYDDLEAQNRLLTERIQQLEGIELAVEAERAEFERLRAATGVDVRPDLARVTATVVRGGVGNFDDDVITIDRGSQDGVRTGMAVVTNAGLVGRVERVDATTSAVLLLTDTDLIVGVRLADTDEAARRFTEAYGVATRLRDPRRLARILTDLASTHAAQRDIGQARTALRRVQTQLWRTSRQQVVQSLQKSRPRAIQSLPWMPDWTRLHRLYRPNFVVSPLHRLRWRRTPNLQGQPSE